MTTTNPYPVDSRTRQCCGAIGGHSRDCPGDSILLADMPVPDGLTAGHWRVDNDGHAYRVLSDGTHQSVSGRIRIPPSPAYELTCLVRMAESIAARIFRTAEKIPYEGRADLPYFTDSVPDDTEKLHSTVKLFELALKILDGEYTPPPRT